jgi:hypothetical protein
VSEQSPEAVTEPIEATMHLAQLAEQPHGVLSRHRQ